MKKIEWKYVFKVLLVSLLITAFYQAWFALGIMMLMVAIGLLILAAEIAFVFIAFLITTIILLVKKKLNIFGWAVLWSSLIFLITNASWVIVLWFQNKS